MKKIIVFLLIFASGISLQAQQKYALVIGNSAYTGISKLSNPVNDASDMEAALRSLGFTVEKVLNGNLDQMETAVMNLKRKLSADRNTYGFFFYAGHGVQANGENYLIPVDANNIQSENHLRQRAVSVQTLLSNLGDAGNELNMIVLDACRDNPFGWSRSGSRGLSVVSAPAGSIVMYATSANSVADDGSGRNGLFTSQLLNNLKTPGLNVRDLFDKTGEDVLKASSGKQHPEISIRFFGAASSYLGARPAQQVAAPLAASATAQIHYDRGVVFFERQDIDTAILEFTEAIRLNPNYADAYAYRARSYNPTNPDQGMADANQALRLDANNALGYFARAYAHISKNDIDKAIADYTQAIRLDPNFVFAYGNRGNAYYIKKDYDKAIADYTQLIRLDPNSAKAYDNRGKVYNDKKDYDKAIADCTQAIRLDPNYAVAYDRRAYAYIEKNDYDKAIADCTQAIKLEPNSMVYTRRGYAYERKGDKTRARADYEAALKIDPNYTYAKNNLNNLK